LVKVNGLILVSESLPGITSSPLAKGDPVLGISGLDPHILAFSTPENAPTEISLGLKKKVGKKKRS
jgi:hypothetical protein